MAVAVRYYTSGVSNRCLALTEISDHELIERTRAGQTEAFSELVRRHQQIVFNLAYRYMHDVTLAEDMAQESFVKGYRLLNGFRGDCSFSTWMYRVTASVCLTEIGRRKKRNETELEARHESQSVDDSIEQHDRAALIRKCVHRLPAKYREIITQYYLQEKPYEEIAKALEVPMGTLKTWMFRARKELRELVESEAAAVEAV